MDFKVELATEEGKTTIDEDGLFGNLGGLPIGGFRKNVLLFT